MSCRAPASSPERGTGALLPLLAEAGGETGDAVRLCVAYGLGARHAARGGSSRPVTQAGPPRDALTLAAAACAGLGTGKSNKKDGSMLYPSVTHRS